MNQLWKIYYHFYRKGSKNFAYNRTTLSKKIQKIQSCYVANCKINGKIQLKIEDILSSEDDMID